MQKKYAVQQTMYLWCYYVETVKQDNSGNYTHEILIGSDTNILLIIE